MRIYNTKLDCTFNGVMLILTKSELEELRDAANNLLENPSLDHIHVLSADLSEEILKEITLASVEAGVAIGGFAPRIQQVIDTGT